MSTLRVLASALGNVAITIVIGTLITLSALVSRSGRYMMPLGRLWSRAVLGAGGVRVAIEGREHARADVPQLYMANHQSMLDIPAIAIAMPDSLRFVAKKALAYVPFFGWAMLATGGCIFIDRGDREQAKRSLQRAGERIRSGHSVLVFPEGTRSPGGRLGEFKKGPFWLAIEARVPIVPVLVEGTAHAMPSGAIGSRGGVVRVKFGAPIVIAEGETPAEISGRLRAALIQMGAVTA